MGIRIGNSYKLPLSSAGAMFSSPLDPPNREHCRPPPLLNDKGQAIPNSA